MEFFFIIAFTEEFLPSVPSRAFEIPHFLKERFTISLESSCHDSLTHWQTVTRDAARSWPPGVNVFSPLIIQVIHFSRKRSLNGLFKQTSRGWTRLVRPPGITAVAVLFSRSCCFTVSVRWALNESQTSKLWVFANPPGRARQTFSIQILTPLSSIHPFGWLCTTTPAGKLSFGIVLWTVMNCHKIWSDIKLVPSCISFHTYFIKFHIPLSLYSFCGSKTADTNELVFTSELTFPVRLDGLIKFSHQRVWLIVYLASLCTHSDIYFHNQTSEYCLFLLKSILFDHKSK